MITDDDAAAILSWLRSERATCLEGEERNALLAFRGQVKILPAVEPADDDDKTRIPVARPAWWRDAKILRAEHKMTCKEISAVVGKPIGQINRALIAMGVRIGRGRRLDIKPGPCPTEGILHETH